MTINQIMALLLPSIISLKIYEKLEGEEKNKQKFVIKYLISLLIVNALAYAITIYVAKQPHFTFTNQFTVKYILLASIIATLYPIIQKIIKTNIGIEVEVKDEKQN